MLSNIAFIGANSNEYLISNDIKTSARPGELTLVESNIARMWSAKCQKCRGNAPYISHFNRGWICDFRGLRCTKRTGGDNDNCSFHCATCGTDICQDCVMYQSGTRYTNLRGWQPKRFSHFYLIKPPIGGTNFKVFACTSGAERQSYLNPT